MIEIEEDGVLGERIEGDLVAETKGDMGVIQELEGVGHGVAVGADVQALNIHW